MTRKPYKFHLQLLQYTIQLQQDLEATNGLIYDKTFNTCILLQTY